MKLITAEIKKKLPALGSTDGNPNAKCIFKLFALGSGCTWYVFEGNLETGELFGLVEGPSRPKPLPLEKEWGYFNLNELQSLRFMGIPRVERDRYFNPITKADLERKLFR